MKYDYFEWKNESVMHLVDSIWWWSFDLLAPDLSQTMNNANINKHLMYYSVNSMVLVRILQYDFHNFLSDFQYLNMWIFHFDFAN